MLQYILSVLVFVGIYGLGAMSFDLLLGYGGLMSLAQASFVGIGAYSSALLSVRLGFEFVPALLIGIGIAALLGLIIGGACLRLSGDYLMVGSLGFLFAIQAILIAWGDITYGPAGVSGIPHVTIGGLIVSSTSGYLALTIIICAILYFISWRLVKSPFGRILQAMREDEIATSAVGKNVVTMKISVFVISAAMAAVSGSLYAHFVRFVNPYSYALSDTFYLFCMVALGGMGTLKGPFLGALILVSIPELARFLGLPTGISGHAQQIIYGGAMILVAFLRPQGLLGVSKHKIGPKATAEEDSKRNGDTSSGRERE